MLSAVVGWLSFCLCSVSALNPIVMGGNMLWDSVTGDRFYMKGITYGYQVSDAYEDKWTAALNNIVALGSVNTIRVYNIDPEIHEGDFQVTNSYDKFMAYCEAHGLYVVVAITPPGFPPWTWCTLNRAGEPTGGWPGGPDNCYPWCLLTYGQATIRAFAKYPHTLAFVAGNEVMNSDTTWKAAPCVKGYIQDLKAYMKRCQENMRYIPLIYAAADNGLPTWGANGLTADDNDRYKAQYLACGPSSMALDIFGLNIYRWCSSQCTFSTCAYQRMHDALKALPMPLVLSEFGCDVFYYIELNNTKGQRDWKQLGALYSSDMTGSWSGGTAYAYGVEGGAGFAFWTGGTTDFFGPPGLTPSCGFPDNVCNADNFKAQLALINPEKTRPVGDVCNFKPANWNPVYLPCPDNFTASLGVDPNVPTRENAEGFISVSCPSHTLTPIEQTLIACQRAKTDAPTPAPREGSPTAAPIKPPTSGGSSPTPARAPNASPTAAPPGAPSTSGGVVGETPTGSVGSDSTAGVIIAVIVVVLLLAAGGAFWYRKRQSRRKVIHEGMLEGGTYVPPILTK